MKWIDTTDIRNWANRRDCQENLSFLVRKLIRSTSDTIQSIKFPSGDNILLGGWDGILEVTKGTEYFPGGISVWEFGVNRNVKGKADEDYEKRSANPLGYNPADSTFFFVTPRIWQNAEEWVTEKKAQGIWKDVRVITAENLEEWIETAPTVGAWLSKHIGKYPEGGMQPSDDFWEEWIAGTKLKLNDEILLGGRKKEQLSLISSVNAPGIIAVQGVSREESLAFIVSSFKNDPEKEEDFFSRSLIVDNPETFRELAVHDKPLILIPRFEDDGIMNRAAYKGHTVIVPLGADSATTWSDKLVLPQIDRDSFVAALTKTGMSNEFAERFSKESARNITILRRQLEFTRTTPAWARPEKVKDIIPALIVGRWDENEEGDRKIIAQIAGTSYEEYSQKLNCWLHTTDSPFIKIGTKWRLASPFDAWANAAKYLTRTDYQLLYKSSLEVLSEVNPVFDLPSGQRYMAVLHNKKREFSDWLREGVAQSLILTSIFGDKLKLDLTINSELWVDRVISELLTNDNPLFWKSVEGVLPLIAEASPNSFLDAIERYLKVDGSPINSLFDEEPGFLTAHSYHTGLLWALEGLAWFPQYLSRAALILAKLAVNDPGGNLANRPINSLSEIFKPWHYQTLASFQERMDILKLMSEKVPGITWTLLIRMLPDSMRNVAMYTHKTRWRMFDLETGRPVTYKEIYDTYSAVVELLISSFDFSEAKLADLIKESVTLSIYDQEKLLTFIESCYKKVEQIEFTAWHQVRKLLHLHRSNPDAEWAIPESRLERFQKLYESLKPEDGVKKSMWMFNDYWPSLPEGYQRKKVSREEQEEDLRKKRIAGLSDVYQMFGIEKVIELSEVTKERWILGETLAYIVVEEPEVNRLCELLKAENDPFFIYGFIYKKSILNGVDWVFALYTRLKEQGFDNGTLARLLVPLNQTQEVWNFVELTNDELSAYYWKGIIPRIYNVSTDQKMFGLKKLVQHKRFFTAIDLCSHFAKEMPTELIVEILEKGGTEKAEEQMRIDGYEVSQLFEELDTRGDITAETLYKLEWLFLPILSRYGSREPKRLHNEMSRNPQFFVDVLSFAYKPDDEAKAEEERKGLSDEQLHNMAHQAFELLYSWKSIPGVDDTGKIDANILKSWVEKVHNLATQVGRLEPANHYIGQVLAHYPETADQSWPPVEICELLEELNTEIVNDNFRAAAFNKRGSSSRGAFDGGEIERGKAKYFSDLANVHRNKYPVVTAIFESLARGYEQDAKRMDESALRRRLER